MRPGRSRRESVDHADAGGRWHQRVRRQFRGPRLSCGSGGTAGPGWHGFGPRSFRMRLRCASWWRTPMLCGAIQSVSACAMPMTLRCGLATRGTSLTPFRSRMSAIRISPALVAFPTSPSAMESRNQTATSSCCALLDWHAGGRLMECHGSPGIRNFFGRHAALIATGPGHCGVDCSQLSYHHRHRRVVATLPQPCYGLSFAAILPGPHGELWLAKNYRGGCLWLYQPVHSTPIRIS